MSSLSVLQPLGWRCAECAVHHEWNVRKEQHQIYVARTSNNRVIMACELNCCLLPQCKVLRICLSGFSIATKWCCDQGVKVVTCETFTKKRAVSAVRCKKEGMLLQPLGWRCAECAVQHERNVREDQYHMYVGRTNNNRVIMALYCCLLPECEALHTCCSGFPIATIATFQLDTRGGVTFSDSDSTPVPECLKLDSFKI